MAAVTAILKAAGLWEERGTIMSTMYLKFVREFRTKRTNRKMK